MKWSRAVVLAAVIATASLVASGGQLARAAAGGGQAQAVAYDGESLLRGLLFGQGKVALAHPELSLATTQGAEAQAVVDRLLTEVKGMDSRFLTRFAAGVQSGDKVKVLTALQEAFDLLEQAVARVYGITVPDSAPSRDLAVAIAAHVYLVAAVFQAVVAATNALVAAHAFAVVERSVFWVFKPTEDSQLRLELWVDKITSALKVS